MLPDASSASFIQYTMNSRMSQLRLHFCVGLTACFPLLAQSQGIVRTHPAGIFEAQSLLGSDRDRDADTARSPHAVQPERPTVATHAGTVAPGWIELEEGVEWDKNPDGSRSFVAPTNLKIGLSPRSQINLLFNLIHAPASITSDLAMGDIGVGIKYRLVDGNPILGDFAVLPVLKLPTGTNGAGTGTTDFSLLLISSRQLGPVAVDLNLGQTRRTGDGSKAPRVAGIWTASFGFPVSGPVGGVVEFFGFPRTSGLLGTDATAALLAGPTFLIKRWFSLDAGMIVPLAGPQARAYYAGFVWNFGCVASQRVCRATRGY